MLGGIEEKENSGNARRNEQERGGDGPVTVALPLWFGWKTVPVEWLSLGHGIQGTAAQ